ncbi:MAG TPA: hypothetical protein VIC59_12245 [Gemmatimonadota bacterium]|jgi:hypothetical protein
MNTTLLSRLAIPICLLALFGLVACSQGGADSLAGPDPGSVSVEDGGQDVSSAGDDAGAPDLAASGRLEARLNPVINVDASGKARLDAAAGTANDRFTVEVEIAKADFARLGIDAGDGFGDEVVQIRILRGGTQIFSRRLQFSENRPRDITFETDVRGAGAPELQRGDVARVTVNGVSTLRGTFN